MPRDHFGEDVAARYDESAGSMFDADVLGPTVEVLAELAGDGAALELAIGTGDRWAGWDRSPFTGESTSHVSVWEKTDR